LRLPTRTAGRKLGGAYFFDGRFLDGARAYGKAFELDGDPWDRILRGAASTDTRLRAGRWQVLKADALNPFAWWNLAVAAEQEGDYETAGLRFLYSAIGFPVDEEAWARSILHLIRAQADPMMSAMVVVTGDRLTAKKAIPTVNRIATEVMAPNARAADDQRYEEACRGCGRSAH
jgi:hypothetical protein